MTFVASRLADYSLEVVSIEEMQRENADETGLIIVKTGIGSEDFKLKWDNFDNFGHAFE